MCGQVKRHRAWLAKPQKESILLCEPALRNLWLANSGEVHRRLSCHVWVFLIHNI